MFDRIEYYEGLINESATIDEAISIIKHHGGNMMEAVVIIKKRFNLSLTEADSVVLNSTYYTEDKKDTNLLRDQISEFINSQKEN